MIADPGIHPGAAALQAVGIHPRVLQGSPARLQHQPLLWIQQVRLDRRNSEEGGVEQVDPVEVTTKPAGLALNLGVREQLSNAPDPGARNALCHGVLAGCEQTPERRKVLRAGEPACHTHDRYRLCGRGGLFIGRIEWFHGVCRHTLSDGRLYYIVFNVKCNR